MMWSNGEVTKAETINYRTFRAEVGGLMDESIFGPTKDFECFCGKYKKVRYKGIVCDRCGVEVTHKRVRRERMGHIKLVSPVTHVWYAHGVPNRLAMILNIPQKKLETVIYYARYVVIDVDLEARAQAVARLKEVKQEEVDALDKELKEKLDVLQADFQSNADQLRKDVKEKEKLGVQLERLAGTERQETAHIKSAYNQKRENLDAKFKELDNLVGDIEVGSTLSEDEHSSLYMYGFDFYQADMGAQAIYSLLKKLDLEKEVAALDAEITETRSELKRSKAIQRKRVLSGMLKAGVKPEWLVVQILPVLPPDLRPIIQLPGGRFATSDLNDLYRRVINRNNRLKRLMELGAPEVILRNEKRMLQEAVDALLDNSHRPGSPTSNSRGVPYKSLSDMLRGKQGRFRQNLLGKRVDYSGRGVIIPGPELKFNQCGLPKTIALELFKPFILRELISRGYATNPAKAKTIFEEKAPIVWDILEEVSKNRPVLLNRAPTLHKQSIIAFYPVLIEGNAIQLHPMMNKGFNADFDGDQMAVHLPLSKQASAEAENRMFAPNNMLSMADGRPIINTAKDMSTGIYMLTKMHGEAGDAKLAAANKDEVVARYKLQLITLTEPVKVLMNGEMITTTAGRIIFNEVLPEGYAFLNKAMNEAEMRKLSADIFNKHGRERAIDMLDAVKELGFKYAREAGFTVAVSEFEFGADEIVDKGIAEFHEREDALLQDYYEGLITKDELMRLQRKEWIDSYEVIWDKVWDLAKQHPNNLTYLDESGATPAAFWVKQISGVRGSVTDPSGNLVDLPLLSNWKKGLSNFEYFVAARYTRKSFADVALRTADSGYLTRRLVDIAQDVVIQEEDCGATEGLYLDRSDKRTQSFDERLFGRFLAEDLVDPGTGEVLAKRNDVITIELAQKINQSETIDKVKVRGPITCLTQHGICQKCYGYDLGTRELVNLGEAVGIIAAQAIGEPSTQLTLKNKSDARATGDVTQGLPRVEELFEIRTPKAKALLAEIPGNVKLIENENDVTVRITSTKKLRKTYEVEEGDTPNLTKPKKVKSGEVIMVKKDGTEIKAEYEGKLELQDGKLYLLVDREIEFEATVDSATELLVQNGDDVVQGQQLTYGSKDPKEIVSIVGVREALQYILDSLQDAYGVYGIRIDDLHIELILAQMSRFGQIVGGGDSMLLPGEFVDRLDIDSENAKLREEGRKQVSFEQVLLGITNAALRTESFLSAASFEQQVRILTEASLAGKVDQLKGLKENVILGRPVPIGNVLLARKNGEEGKSYELSIGDGKGEAWAPETEFIGE